MHHYGDLAVAATLNVAFNTEDPTGAPITLAGSPAVRAYKDASLTETATGVTLSVDFDGRTGLHMVTIDTSTDGTFYAAGSTFHVVLTVGTVNSISVAGLVLASFSIGSAAAYARIGAAGAGLTALGDTRLANLDRALSALFTTAMVESYNADGSPPTAAQALFVIMQRLTEFAISGTTITAKKLDGSTTAFTLTLDAASSPTSSTRAS